MFEPFPKLARLKRSVVITEKLDGTNAQVYITLAEPTSYDAFDNRWHAANVVATINGYDIYAGSRTRLITPGKDTDNYGFAGWVKENAEELVKLGPGRWFGEWYGQGIQRNYGLKERRFALFNTFRPKETLPSCVEQVPVLWGSDFSNVESAMSALKQIGSQAVPGFMNPEGVVVYHTASRTHYKQTFEHDEHGKEAALAA
jgi:hypothetical protein